MLMSTYGARLENPSYAKHVHEYFERIKLLSKVNCTKKKTIDKFCFAFTRFMCKLQHKVLPPRIRFGLIDLLELRDNQWEARRKVEGPTTIDEVHEEAERKDNEAARFSRNVVRTAFCDSYLVLFKFLNFVSF